MIEEAYCNPEIAELLKEKGMDKECFTHYIQKNNSDGTSEAVTTCTQQMAMRWLREAHNIGIFPSTYTHIVDRKTTHSYGTAIISLKTYELMIDNYLSNDNYEGAVETAIKYCLENLI
jgi:hypothetical protein